MNTTRDLNSASRTLCALLMPMLCALALLAPSAADAQGAPTITLWHAYRGAEEAALGEALVLWNARHPEQQVKALSLPYEAFATKLTNAIPRGHGPDVFIAAHESLGEWSIAGLVAPWAADEAPWGEYHPTTVDAVSYQGTRWGVPLASKSLVLFYNTALVKQAPTTTDGLIEQATALTDAGAGRYGLAYEAANFYMHAPWLFGFGGRIFDDKGELALNSKEVAASYAFAFDLVNKRRIVPEDASGALVGTLFNEQKAAFVISGPWFLGEINKDVPFALAPLPKVSATGLAAKPLLTVEAAFVSNQSPNKQQARALAVFLASDEIARIRAVRGLQPVATLKTYEHADVAAMGALAVFREQLDAAVPMPNDPRMRSVWEPANQALRQVLRGAAEPAQALSQAAFRYKIYTRPAPAPSPIAPFLAVTGGMLALLLGLGVWRLRGQNLWPQVKRSWSAYLYLAPASLGMVILVVAPFVVGSAVSLFAHQGGEFTFVGFSNFIDIITSKDYGIMDPLSFYYTLLVTVAWTAVNVFFHVSFGLLLALLLREPWLKLRGLYRVLLIIPWAIPNYITALIWKGMFHKQYGAINGILKALGAEPISWFSQFSTAFAANVATNTWLGFPFMMVVILGALQAIPKDLEEAAEVDGATRWQRFRHVILPLLRPSLVPAVILGTVWTFNMFNIIYLVSGGEPDGSTEILISEAYKWAFQRQQQYGYAAAYAVLIFFVLLIYSWSTGQLKNQD
jgi:arabinogalactan oligomer/maltooligosaccharide transport system permease protein